MKTKLGGIQHPEIKPAAAELWKTIVQPGRGVSITVPAAKAKFAALLEPVAGGQEVTITSDGKPKAVLSSVGRSPMRKVFTGMGDYLKSMPRQTEGPLADEIVRVDRDGRGW
jgi:prevent-host-death family protein